MKTQSQTRLALALAGSALAAAAPVWAAPLTVQIPIGGVFISDGGIGDLDPADGVIRFDASIDDNAPGGAGHGRRRFEGRALYVPGTPYVGALAQPGITGFGVVLTDFVMTSLEGPFTLVPPCYIGDPFSNDTACTNNNRPVTTFGQMDVFVQGSFNLGVATFDQGYVVDHLSGSVRTDVDRVFLGDLASWAGSPSVGAGHLVPVVNPASPSFAEVPFNFGDVASPLSLGILPVEFVTYQLLTYYIPPNELGQLRLPSSGSAIVQAIPEPQALGLVLGGLLAGWAGRRASGARLRRQAA
ncbi:MAG: hypothetical protein JNJ60_22475 [Rhodocyclaceae bacterium]|nr:hypothetical protein [Rhodocyclaceae bacterium]